MYSVCNFQEAFSHFSSPSSKKTPKTSSVHDQKPLPSIQSLATFTFFYSSGNVPLCGKSTHKDILGRLSFGLCCHLRDPKASTSTEGWQIQHRICGRPRPLWSPVAGQDECPRSSRIALGTSI